ncbi:hypothetical protein F2Q70_00017141 [Brassica cretica]|uniref:Uncharacterized protein n=1 Tax=Brassica cretica TaxID=69181 RepID=A0A8S9HWK7_BRACR|nr:hypothetical protein F2Q70_00017141 [Brassica cretica]
MDCLDGMPLSWAFLRPILDYCDLLQVNLGSTTVSGVGLSAGKAMGLGTMSLSGVVAWLDDSGLLFMELSGAF